MPIINKLPRARSDFDEIWDYIADDSETRADSFIDKIDKSLRTLSKNPRIGRLRDELGECLYSFPIGRYLIFYRVITGGIEVVRVLHSSRDINTDFFNDE